MVSYAEKFRAYNPNTNFPPTFGTSGQHYYFWQPNITFGKNMCETGESLESAKRPDSIPRTIYPDHQIELEALANQYPIDIVHMLDHLPEPDVTEQSKRKTITQGLLLHEEHNYLSTANDVAKGTAIGPISS